MFIVCLTIFSSILSPLQPVSYVKVHVYCVFDYFLFNLVSTSVGELRESACLLCVWLFSLQSCLHFSRWVTWKCMFIVCLTIFSSILSPLQHVSYVKVHVYCVFDYFLLQSCLHFKSVSYVKVHVYCVFDYFLFNLVSTSEVSYVKVHVYCVFDYFLFNLVSTSAGELRESACLLCVWLFSLQSCLHFSRWVTWKCMFIVCLTIFSSILSPLQSVSYVKVHVYCVFDYFLFNLVSTSVGELRESACLLCVWLFSLQSCLHFSRWVTWKCMFIVCLTIFSSILSPLQSVSYVKVHVYCVFDYFLFNLVSTQIGELRESDVIVVLQKCMFIVCLTIFSSILSPLQRVSYVKVHVYCVFDYFLFNLVSTSAGELRESACLLCVWLFSLQSCLHFSVVSYVKVHVYCVFEYFLFNLVSTSGGELRESACLCVFDYFLFNLVSTSAGELHCVWVTFSLESCAVTWKCMFIVCLTIFSSILSPLQSVSYVKVHVYCVFDYFLFNLVSTSVGELRESACLLCVWLFSLQSCLHFRWWVTWKCMFIVCLTIFSSILSPLQLVSYVKVHVYCVFDYFLFNLVSTSVGELRESVCLLCVWLFSLQSCLHFSLHFGELRESACLLCVWLFSLQSCLQFSLWVTWKCMFIVCLTIFSSILSPLQRVSYVKVHVYCVFDYFLFNLVSTSGGELRESACLLCVWLFSLQSCLHFSRWVCMLRESACYVKVHVYCVFDYFLFNLVSTSVCELRESACLLCVWLFSLQSCLHFSYVWVTWKCMLIVCLTIFSSILSPIQLVSYVKVHVYCVFDYFLFNLVSTSVGELCESACLLCVWLFSLQSCMVSYSTSCWHVSYVKVHVYCVFDYFLFNLVSTSVCKLRESACLLCVWLFSLQSCLHFRLCVTWKCMFIVYLTIFTTSDRDELFAFV